MSGESIHAMGQISLEGKPVSQMQPLCWDLPYSVTCHDTRMQHVNREDEALLKGRRMLQGNLEKRMIIEHKSGEIQLIV